MGEGQTERRRRGRRGAKAIVFSEEAAESSEKGNEVLENLRALPFLHYQDFLTCEIPALRTFKDDFELFVCSGALFKILKKCCESTKILLRESISYLVLKENIKKQNYDCPFITTILCTPAESHARR